VSATALLKQEKPATSVRLLTELKDFFAEARQRILDLREFTPAGAELFAYYLGGSMKFAINGPEMLARIAMILIDDSFCRNRRSQSPPR
jgi:hypothetical protein